MNAVPDMVPTRPALRYHGGKWLLAPWIIEHFPTHRVYVEPFGGAASVLIRKPRSYGEIYNDLADEVVNLFHVLRDNPDELIDAIRKTPFSRSEFNLSYEVASNPVEEARRLVARSFMGFGSDGHNRAVKTGFRANSNRSGTTPAHDWTNLPDALEAVVTRFQGVVIENRPALDVAKRHAGPETLTYFDPPYLPDTRSQKSRRGKIRYHAYTHEMTVTDHEDFLSEAFSLDGMVVVSGYPSEMYDEAFDGWRRTEKTAMADGARERTEVLWVNPRTATRLDAEAEERRHAEDMRATPLLAMSSVNSTELSDDQERQPEVGAAE